MIMDEKALKSIEKETTVSKYPITIHIDYTESLTLKELSEVFDLINKAINDVNRKNGIKNNAKLGKEYAAEVTGVDSGSIVVHILTTFVAPVALNIVASFLYDRLKGIGAKKEKNLPKEDTGYPISVTVNGNDNLIEIHIIKPGNT